MFVRKRDPRYKRHIAHQARNNLTKVNPSPSSAPKPMSRTAQTNITPYVEQEWQKASQDHQHDDLEWAAAGGEDPEEWECVACGKAFKSEAAWNSHERSKKHLKEVERLKRQILRENEELGLSGEGTNDGDGLDRVVENDKNEQPPSTPSEEGGNVSDTVSVAPSESVNGLENAVVSEEPSKDEEQLQVEKTPHDDDEVDSQPPTASTPQELSKREKRKLREARKAQATATMSAALVGRNVCCNSRPDRRLGLQCLQKPFRKSN